MSEFRHGNAGLSAFPPRLLHFRGVFGPKTPVNRFYRSGNPHSTVQYSTGEGYVLRTYLVRNSVLVYDAPKGGELMEIKITPRNTVALTPPEIRFLERARGRTSGVAVHISSDYQLDYETVMEKMLSSGYLKFGSVTDNVGYLDMQTLRKLAKDRGLKAGGKKVDIAQRVLDNYSVEELEALDLPEYIILTDVGQQVLEENSALILYYGHFGSREWTDPERIVKAQKAHPDVRSEDILICLLKEEIEKADSVGKKRYLTAFLCRMFELKGDTVLVQEAEAEIQRLDAEWEKEHQKEKERLAAFWGLSVEEYDARRERAMAEFDSEWEKELDRQARERAGATGLPTAERKK